MSSTEAIMNLPAGEGLDQLSNGHQTEVLLKPSRWRLKLFRFTVEPILFSIFLAQTLSDAVVTNLILSRTCEIELKFNESFCNALGTNTEEGHKAEALVQPHASVLLMGKTLIGAIFPAIMSLFLGPWSDLNGRRLLLIVPLSGHVIMYIVYAILAYIPNLHPAYFMLAAIPFSLSGGYITALTGAYCYISDITKEEERSLRLGILEGMLFAGVLIGMSSSSFIFSSCGYYGYLVIFSIAGLVCFSTFIYTYFLVPESINRYEESEGIRGVFKTKLIKEMMITCFKKRENSGRAVILMVILSLALTIFSVDGASAVLFLFTRVHFGWSLQQYTIWFSSQMVVLVIGAGLGCGLLSKRLKVSDSILGMAAHASKTCECIFFAFVPSNVSYLMYVGAFISLLAGVTGPVSRSLLSKNVPKEDLGKVFSLTSVLESLSPLAASPVYTLIYNSTLDILPGAFCLFSALIYFTNFMFFLIIVCLSSRPTDPSYTAIEEDHET